eukprot:TCONS_00062720-protein
MPAITPSTFVTNFKSVFAGNGNAQSNPSIRQTEYVNKKIISETLLQELEFQITENENYAKDLEKQKNNASGRPDYTWLMDKPKTYRLPPLTRLELEEMSKYLHVDDVSLIIQEFRDAIDYDVAVDKLANYLKFIMNHHIHEKRKTKNSDEYQRLQLTTTNSAPVRSQSSAIMKQIKMNTLSRPSSAPLTNTWKKRVRVHPMNAREISNDKSDAVYIDLSGHTQNDNFTDPNNNFTDQNDGDSIEYTEVVDIANSYV